jgi:hypothetical protein
VANSREETDRRVMAWVGAARRKGRAATLVAAGLGLCLCLAGCMEQPAAPPANATAAAEPMPGGPQPPPRPPRKPRPPTLAALNPAKPEPPTAETQDFDQLQGLDQDAMTQLFGEPAERTEAPPAVLWRYAGRDCAVDVYFYLDLESRALRVLHYEVRNTDGSKRPERKCYDELVAARAAEQTGGTDRPR